ncbi:hydroxysqualene dehydroxylase HpnE [Novispirillum sp. DQ9]|uniref:hydroxysqualene dehydroxylase HpnE n=1 Tax=Novispirillum sp. DQ9 TaxID=3398612 RepID=UPI003C7DEC5E
MNGAVYIIGAGLAGLSCAVELRRRGLSVSLHEAAPMIGGRCRSFTDRRLGRVLDNGAHLVLSANRAVLDYCHAIGGGAALVEAPAAFPFVDLADGARWVVRPGGRVPWWLLARHRRVPGVGIGPYLALMPPWRPHPSETVLRRWGDSPLFRRLIEPLSTAILNTAPEEASALLLRSVLDETLGRGAAACRPYLAPHGLGAALVDPAQDWLRAHGATLHTSDALTGLETHAGRVQALTFQKARLPLGPGDSVVLAVPSAAAHRLVPSIVPPLASRPIINAHFAVSPQDDAWRQAAPLTGIVGGLAQWVFVRPDVVSVTVSCPGPAADLPAEALAERLWQDVRAALALENVPRPPCRVIKERRATLAHSPGQEILRPGPRTPLANLILAGDWTDTGLPCTLEGAVRSGIRAAHLVAEGISAFSGG